MAKSAPKVAPDPGALTLPPRPRDPAAAKKWDEGFAMIAKAVEAARKKELVGEDRKVATRKHYVVGAQLYALELREPGRSWTLDEVIATLTRATDRRLFGLKISEEDAAKIAAREERREAREAETAQKELENMVQSEGEQAS